MSSMTIIPGLENIFFYYCKLFGSAYALSQHSISLLSAGTTLVNSLLIRVVPGQRGGINESCKSLLYWVYGRCPLKSVLERSWRHYYGPRLCNITDFYHYVMHPLKNFYTPLSGPPQKCFKSGPALANAGPACLFVVLWTHNCRTAAALCKVVRAIATILLDLF